MKKRSMAAVVSRLDRLIAIDEKNHETLEQIQRLLFSKRGEVTLAITQEDAVRRIAFACREAGVPKAAFSLKTLQRMEKGVAEQRAGYSVMVRYSDATFQAWLNAYIAQSVSRLRPDRAVRYEENVLEHNCSPSPSTFT